MQCMRCSLIIHELLIARALSSEMNVRCKQVTVWMDLSELAKGIRYEMELIDVFRSTVLAEVKERVGGEGKAGKRN